MKSMQEISEKQAKKFDKCTGFVQFFEQTSAVLVSQEMATPSFQLLRSKKRVILDFFFSHITHIQPVSKSVHSNFKTDPESNFF